MKKWISAVLVLLFSVMAVLPGEANLVLADSPDSVPEQQLQEYLRKYKYPYSEVPPAEKVQLARYAIKKLSRQIANFQPGKGTTLTHLTSTLTHMQELLAPPVEGTFTPDAATEYAGVAGVTPVAINMIYYGWNTSSTDLRIINSLPELLVNNSPAGPWGGNADVSKFASAGIKYFEYIDGGHSQGQFPMTCSLT